MPAGLKLFWQDFRDQYLAGWILIIPFLLLENRKTARHTHTQTGRRMRQIEKERKTECSSSTRTRTQVRFTD